MWSFPAVTHQAAVSPGCLRACHVSTGKLCVPLMTPIEIPTTPGFSQLRAPITTERHRGRQREGDWAVSSQLQANTLKPETSVYPFRLKVHPVNLLIQSSILFLFFRESTVWISKNFSISRICKVRLYLQIRLKKHHLGFWLLVGSHQ